MKIKMKRNPDLIYRSIAGESVLVPTGQLAQMFNGMITLNEVAAFIWENLEKVDSQDELLQLVLDEFEVEEAAADADVNGFLRMLLERGFATLEQYE